VRGAELFQAGEQLLCMRDSVGCVAVVLDAEGLAELLLFRRAALQLKFENAELSWQFVFGCCLLGL
jgi:hypothetical protein